MALAALLPPGCARTVQVKSTFDAKQAAYINTKGKATINGQAFLRRNDGVVVYAAGSNVGLIPATTYATERIGGIYGDQKYLFGLAQFKIEGDDAEYQSFRRITKANGEGRFTFPEVAPGAYFIITNVQWCAPSQYGCNPQGGSLMERVTIKDAEKVELVVDGK